MFYTDYRELSFSNKDIQKLKEVIELWDLEPENNHVHAYVVSPAREILEAIEYGDFEEATMVSSFLYNEIKINSDKCRQKKYNRRIRAVRDMLASKLEK